MFFSRLYVVGDFGTNKRSLRELWDNLAIHGDWGVLSTSTISRHVRTKLPGGQKYSHKRLGKCASKIIYCKRHAFSCQTVDKSATIICISGAKTLPSGKIMFSIQQTEAEFEQFESHSFSSKIIFKQAVENLVRTFCKIVRF